MKAFAAAHPAPTGGPSVDQLLALVGNKDEVDEGKEVYVKNCVACHRADGGGMIGPNLTDDYWIHGASLDSVYTVVSNGFRGLPPPRSRAQDVERVVAYIATLRGTNGRPESAAGCTRVR
jgi:cytochrome c oxidase cbb3-type subunit 3